MKAMRRALVMVAMLGGLIVSLSGCADNAGSLPVGVGVVPDPAPATLRLAVRLDAASANRPLAALLVASGTATPTVTFTVRFIDFAAASTSERVQTVPVAAGDVASATFTNLPLTTLLGEVAVGGGTIGSATEFHGALDLVTGENALLLHPVGTQMTQDLVAQVVKRVLASRDVLQRHTVGLVGRIRPLVELTPRTSATLVDDLFAGLQQAVGATGPAQIQRIASPTGVVTEPGYQQVRVSWQPVDGAARYVIYSSIASNLPLLARNRVASVTASATSYVHSGLTTSEPRYYAVVAVASGGVESLRSEIVSALPRSSRFSRDDNGIITDYKTFLQWREGPDSNMSWRDAQAWVSGLGGWRMPSLSELAGLYLAQSSRINHLDPAFRMTANPQNVFASRSEASTGWFLGFLTNAENFAPIDQVVMGGRAFAVR